MDKTRTAVLKVKGFSSYTGTYSVTGVEFFGWDDEPDMKKRIKKLDDYFTVEIPVQEATHS